MSKIRLQRNMDGTLATRGRFAAENWKTRVAVGAQFVGKTVEIELWNRYGDNEAVFGKLLAAAVADGGTTRDLIVLFEHGDVLPTAYSGARVLSISELTDAELSERVHNR